MRSSGILLLIDFDAGLEAGRLALNGIAAELEELDLFAGQDGRQVVAELAAVENVHGQDAIQSAAGGHQVECVGGAIVPHAPLLQGTVQFLDPGQERPRQRL
jgi:hypothetical protein